MGVSGVFVGVLDWSWSGGELRDLPVLAGTPQPYREPLVFPRTPQPSWGSAALLGPCSSIGVLQPYPGPHSPSGAPQPSPGSYSPMGVSQPYQDPTALPRTLQSYWGPTALPRDPPAISGTLQPCWGPTALPGVPQPYWGPTALPIPIPPPAAPRSCQLYDSSCAFPAVRVQLCGSSRGARQGWEGGTGTGSCSALPQLHGFVWSSTAPRCRLLTQVLRDASLSCLSPLLSGGFQPRTHA